MTVSCVRRVLGLPAVEMVIVIDNGSGDRDWEVLQRELGGDDRVMLDRMSSNLGYAGGMQSGINTSIAAGADFVWLLNNDCQVDGNSLDPLLSEMANHPETAVCSGLVTFETPHGVQLMDGLRFDLLRGEIVELDPEARPVGNRYLVEVVPGVAWLLRASAIRTIGGLDCRLFLLGEEPDWCHRARLAGLKAVIVPGASVRTLRSETLRRFYWEQRFYYLRNSLWLVRRQGTPWQRLVHHLLFVFYRLPKVIVGRLVRRESRHIPLILRAAWSGLTGSIEWSDDPDRALENRLPSLA